MAWEACISARFFDDARSSPEIKKLKPALDSQDRSRAMHLQFGLFNQIKRPRSNCWRREACISAWFFDDARGFGRIKILPSVIVPWNKMKHASDSRDQGLRTCSSDFSIKLNGHGVIVNGMIGLYFDLNFRWCKRFWEEFKYHHQISSPDKKLKMHQIAEIKG